MKLASLLTLSAAFFGSLALGDPAYGKSRGSSKSVCVVACKDGFRCDATTNGQCMSVSRDTCPGTCGAGLHCDSSTKGLCVPDTRTCVAACIQGTRCDSATGKCVPDKSSYKGCKVRCKKGNYCDTLEGKCLPCDFVAIGDDTMRSRVFSFSRMCERLVFSVCEFPEPRTLSFDTSQNKHNWAETAEATPNNSQASYEM